ncbi:MAG: hypothetical protein JXM73_02660 [Anaerolineae bacterium]|nr:hypothetical protein [Anaerolineae bacterium]
MEGLNQEIADDVARRSKVRRIVTDLLKALEENDADAAARILQNRTGQLTDIYPRAKTTLEKLGLDLNRRQEEQLRETCTRLEEYCRAERIPLKGKPPKYTADHLLEIEFDRKKIRTKVGIQSLSTFEWPSVRDALAAERARLWQRPFNAASFRDRLVQAYRELERVGPSPTGWASLEGVYQILKQQVENEGTGWRKGGRLIAYYKDEFSADLSLLWEAQALKQLGSPHVELSSIRDPRRAYKVIQPDHNVGFYGFLRPGEV